VKPFFSFGDTEKGDDEGMKNSLSKPAKFSVNLRALTVICLLSCMVGAMAFTLNKDKPINVGDKPALPLVKKDSIASVKAFSQVYTVLMSARCMNCHPLGNVPLQGNDSHLHTMLPQRGKDGKGVYAMKCANCHQATNTSGLHMPPGNPNWHLPPADMRIGFPGQNATSAGQTVDRSETEWPQGYEKIDCSCRRWPRAGRLEPGRRPYIAANEPCCFQKSLANLVKYRCICTCKMKLAVESMWYKSG
jgi:hypothetical protein